MYSSRSIFLPALLALSLLPAASSKSFKASDNPRWSPVVDRVYLQEVGEQIPTDYPLSSAAILGDEVFVGSPGGLLRVQENKLVPVEGFSDAVVRLEVLQNALWVFTPNALIRFSGGQALQIGAQRALAICEHLGEIVVATADGVFRLDGETLAPIKGSQVRGDLVDMVSYAETLYFLYPGVLALFDGEDMPREEILDWGGFPSRETRDVLVQGGAIYFATGRGLACLRGMAMTIIEGKDGLPYEDVNCLAEGFADDLWIGTQNGATRHVGGEFHYFARDRWLPGDVVTGIACSEDTAYIATDKGLGIIRYEPYTLQKKAAFYERHLEEWGQKRLGFIHKLDRSGPNGEWVREVSDNDGGWTAHYLSAMSFKYAITGDEADHAEALNSFRSIEWLEEMPPMDGFPARSVWAVGEKGNQAQHGSGGLPAEWHLTEDGLFQWKGDTSSDEIDAHFYALPIFLEAAAKGEEKDRALGLLERMAAHIYDNGWVLVDVDGKPTRWARWDPEYLQRPYGYYARGLNGMEALARGELMKSISDDPKFVQAHKDLIELGYHRETLRQKLVFPPNDITHFDDRLAFFSYFPLLTHATDPHLRSIYMRSLERTWEVERIERNPWFNFIYGVVTGNECEEEQAVQSLRDWPLDLIDYSYWNSHRHDLHTPAGYTSYARVPRPLSPRETGPHRWDASFHLDNGSGGNVVVDPSGWLDAYWMGRYYGLITGPETEEAALISVPKRNVQLGAEPYQGPARPEWRPRP